MQTKIRTAIVPTGVFLWFFCAVIFSAGIAGAFEKKDWDGVWVGKWGRSVETSVTIRQGQVREYKFRGASQQTGKTRITKKSLIFGIGKGYKIELVSIDKNSLRATFSRGKSRGRAHLKRRGTVKETESPATSKTNHIQMKGPLFSDKDTIKLVQTALTKFGYQPGLADGIEGKGTRREIRKFRRDTALPTGNRINEQLLRALGIRNILSPHRADIFVLNEPSGKLGKRLESLERSQVLAELEALAKRDQKHIDLIFSKPKSIVFVVHTPLKAGTKVRTYASNVINGKRNAWSQSYQYVVEKGAGSFPFVVINEFETGNPMFLIHELFVGNEKIASRFTKAR